MRYTTAPMLLSNLEYKPSILCIQCREHHLFGGLLEVTSTQKLAVGIFQDQVGRTYVIRSFLSLSFFKPPKAILVPGMYFFGFSRYSN